MLKLDIKLTTQYVASLTTIVIRLDAADYTVRQLVNGHQRTIYVDSTPDHDNDIYTGVQDWLDTNYVDMSTNILTYANLIFGDIYELGDMILVDQQIDDEIQKKQDKHANLTALSDVTLASGKQLYATGASGMGVFDSTSYGRSLNNLANQAALQSAVGISTVGLTGAYSDLTGKPSLAAVATSGDYNDLSNKPSIPSTARTTSALSLSLVGTGATGTQISSTKDSSVKCNVSTSTTSTIGGPATSLVALKICATNDATEANWTTVATFESDQTITLAVVLNSVQVVKGQICADVPAGYYVKLVNSGTGTHSESFVSGQKTIYG